MKSSAPLSELPIKRFDLTLTELNQAVRKVIPFLLAGALACTVMLPANAITPTESGAVNATIDLVRQFSQRVSLAQSAGYLDEQISEVNGAPRAARMAPIPLNFAPADVRPVPPITGLPRRDGAGRPLGYCAWDNTSATNVSIGGTLAYLAGNIPGNSDKLVYAVISPGRDGRIETSCADVLLLQQTIQSERGGGLGDDLVYARRPLQQSSRTFRANVGTQSGLPVSDNTEGDVRLVMDTNTLYAYNGGSWQAIGGNPAERFTGDGSGNLSYTGGKVTVADFEATTATLSASLTVNGTTALNGITSITGATTVNGAFTATTLSGSAAGLTDLNANNIASGTLAVARGGTGLGTAPALNQVLIGNGTGYGLSTVTAGTGIGVTNAGGLLTISNTGLLSISSPMSTVNVSTTNGVVTLDLPQSVATTATPTFGGMMLNGGLTGTTASFTGAVTASRLDVSTSAGGVTNPNMIVGVEAMQGTPSGDGANTALGIKALRNNTTGAFNVAVGSDSQSANTTGGYNVGVGIQTLLNSTTGINNTALGSFAGDTNTSGGNNTLLGYAADVAAGNLSYSTAIGASSVVATSNTVAIGRNSTADQVVIGTDTRNDTTANTKLYVNGISRFNGLQYGTSSTYSGTVTANLFSGSGASLTNLSAGNISSGTLAVARGGTGLGTTPNNGQLLIGNGAGYTLATLTGTANQVSIINGAGSVTLSLPQNIATTSTPTFGGMTLNGGLTGTTSNFSGRVDAGSVYIGGSQVLPLTRANINSTMTFATSNLTLGTSNFTDLDEALRNVTIGIGGMPALRDGSDNAGLGYQSLVTLRDGSGNTALGSRALDSIRDGNNNTAIGAFADVTNDSLDYAAAIGASSTVATSNTMALGRSGNADQVVVGTSSRNDTYANTKLYVNGISNFNGAMYGTAGAFSGTVNANLFSGSGASLTNLNAGNISSGTLPVARGGTGLGTTPTNGQLLIGNGTGYTLGTLTGTANQVVVTNSAGGVTLSLPQSIAVTSTPTFGGMTLTGGLTGTTGTFSGAVTAATLSAARLNVGTSVGVGTSNLIVGNGAMSGVQSGNGGNTALGTNALASNSTGYYNIAVGEMALVANTTGDTNISIGYQSMYDNTSGHQNVAMGYLALSSNTGGIANNAIGYVALGSNTTGYDNIAFGVLAGISNSTGYSNTFLGARTNATSGALTYASAIGAESAVSTSNTLVLGRTSDVTVIGATGDNGSGDRLQVTGSSGVSGNVILRNSGTGTTTGSKLIFGGIGEESDTVYFGRINASPDTTILQLHLADNPGTAVGAAGDRFQIVTGSGPSTIDGPFSVRHYFDSDGSAFHAGALSVGSLIAPRIDIATSTGVSIANMIVGAGAMPGAQSGEGGNTALGVNALASNTDGEVMVAVGHRALFSNTSGSYNVAVGKSALESNTFGGDNIAVGWRSLNLNTEGYDNVALGDSAMYGNTTGGGNAAVGDGVLGFNTTGNANSAFGDGAMYLNITGSNNSAFGAYANVLSDALNFATAIGSESGVSTSNTVVLGRPSDVTVIGSTGDNGSGNLLQVTGGGYLTGNFTVLENVRLGGGAGGNRRIYLGPDNPGGGGGDEVYFRYYVRGGEATTLEMYSGNDADDHININPSLGNVGIGVESPGAKLHVNGGVLATSYSTSSDRRLKSNILALDSDDLLSRLSGVVAHRYNYIAHPEVGTRIGVIAQEIQALFPEVATYNKDNFMSVDYNALGAMAAAGVGRLNSKFNAFEKFTKDKFDSVDKEIASLKTETAKIKGLEDWREVANTRMDTMQSSIDKNLAKITENTLAIEKNTAQIKRLDDVLVTLDTTVKGQGEAIDGINNRWGKTFTASEDGTMLTVTAAELKVNNFTAQQVRTNSLYTARLEAEMAKIKELDIDRLRANSAVANTLQAEQMNTGAAQVYAGVGAPAFLFSASTDGHYTVNTSALDGSYATATVIVNAGQAKIIPIANEGIQLMAVGNTVKAIAAGKGIKATWIKMG